MLQIPTGEEKKIKKILFGKEYTVFKQLEEDERDAMEENILLKLSFEFPYESFVYSYLF